MKDPIRVAALIDSFDVSGPGPQLVGLVPRLQRHGVETRVGAVPEVVTEPLVVHLVEPGCPKALAETMLNASLAPLSQDAIERSSDAHLQLYRTLPGAPGSV